MPSLRCSGFQSINPPAPADLAAAGGQARARDQVFLDRLFEPHVDVVQAAAATGRRVAALEHAPGVARGQKCHVFDGILDVEISQLGDVEIGRMKMGLDQSGQDRPAAGIDVADVRLERLGGACRPGIGDLAVLDEHGCVRDGRRAGPVHEPAVGDQRHSLRGLHRHGLIDWGLLTAIREPHTLHITCKIHPREASLQLTRPPTYLEPGFFHVEPLDISTG